VVESLQKVVTALSSLPTIGQKSALRMALYLLNRPQSELDTLASAVAKLKSGIGYCPQCHNLRDAHEPLCSICASAKRNRDTICVVEKATDILALEKTGTYNGMYHVLGGVLSPLSGITAEQLNIQSLITRIEKEQTSELIFGLGSSVESESTALYLSKLLKGKGVTITRLARGLPAGLELEYVDQLTLSQAFASRTGI